MSMINVSYLNRLAHPVAILNHKFSLWQPYKWRLNVSFKFSPHLVFITFIHLAAQFTPFTLSLFFFCSPVSGASELFRSCFHHLMISICFYDMKKHRMSEISRKSNIFDRWSYNAFEGSIYWTEIEFSWWHMCSTAPVVGNHLAFSSNKKEAVFSTLEYS